MTMLTSKDLVAFAVVAIASVAVFCGGCSRDEEPREASGAAVGETSPWRTDDPVYEAKLDERVEARNKLLAIRANLVSRLEDADDAEKASLQARIDDVNKALEDERGRAMKAVRERIWAADQPEAQKGSAAQ